MQVTKNFHSEYDHMTCPCCGGFVYESHFMDLIQVLRDIIGLPFYLDPTGGAFYRCRFYNESIGGATSSRHLNGSAMDVSTVHRDGSRWDGTIKWAIQFEAMKLGLSVGKFSRYFHLDLRPGKPVLFP